MRCCKCGTEAPVLKTCRQREGGERTDVLCDECWLPLRELVWIVPGPISCFGKCRDYGGVVQRARVARPVAGREARCLGRDVWGVSNVVYACMERRRKLYDRIVSGGSDANIPFEQAVNMLKVLGFDERISGSHHIFVKESIEEIITLQDIGGECKPYQVKQMRAILKKYNLRKEL